jgi:peptide/nickel transport system permease protein
VAMFRFLLGRIAQALPLLAGVVLLVFVMLQLTPGDPVQAIVGDYPVPDAFRQAISREYHLGDPLPERLLFFVHNLVRGNLGFSFQGHQPVLDMILERAPRTLLLAGAGFCVAVVGGLLLGAWAAVSRHRWLESTVMGGVLVAFAIPGFWLGQILVLIFALRLGWFPTQGMGPLVSDATGLGIVWERLPYLVLPASIFAVHEGARVARLTRISVLDTLNHAYIATAELKGLSPGKIMLRHVARNSILPVVTVMGHAFAVAMGGSVLIESVFSWPGIGLLLVDSIRLRDNQVVVGIVLFVALSVVLMNILVDVAYAWLDPRIR